MMAVIEHITTNIIYGPEVSELKAVSEVLYG